MNLKNESFLIFETGGNSISRTQIGTVSHHVLLSENANYDWQSSLLRSKKMDSNVVVGQL